MSEGLMIEIALLRTLLKRALEQLGELELDWSDSIAMVESPPDGLVELRKLISGIRTALS